MVTSESHLWDPYTDTVSPYLDLGLVPTTHCGQWDRYNARLCLISFCTLGSPSWITAITIWGNPILPPWRCKTMWSKGPSWTQSLVNAQSDYSCISLAKPAEESPKQLTTLREIIYQCIKLIHFRVVCYTETETSNMSPLNSTLHL